MAQIHISKDPSNQIARTFSCDLLPAGKVQTLSGYSNFKQEELTYFCIIFYRPEGTIWVVGLGRNFRINCWAYGCS